MDYSKLHWWSDWDYSDLGLEGEGVIGLYQSKYHPEVQMYIDVEKDKIIDMWLEYDEEE